ncbi:hypothetical protein PENTCL1PPCAC_17599, partial [Pristionchus entomophagus]
LAVAVIQRRGSRAPYFNSHLHYCPPPSLFPSWNGALGLTLPAIFFLSSPFSLSARDETDVKSSFFASFLLFRNSTLY